MNKHGINEDKIFELLNEKEELVSKLEDLDFASEIMLRKLPLESIKKQITLSYPEITQKEFAIEELLNVTNNPDAVSLRSTCSGWTIFGKLAWGSAKAAAGCGLGGPGGCIVGLMVMAESIYSTYNYACENCQACN